MKYGLGGCVWVSSCKGWTFVLLSKTAVSHGQWQGLLLGETVTWSPWITAAAASEYPDGWMWGNSLPDALSEHGTQGPITQSSLSKWFTPLHPWTYIGCSKVSFILSQCKIAGFFLMVVICLAPDSSLASTSHTLLFWPKFKFTLPYLHCHTWLQVWIFVNVLNF